jgi:hypothetical protein
MTKNRDLNDGILFADLNFRNPTSKPPKPPKQPKKRKSRFRWLFLIIICGALFGGAMTMVWYSYMRGYDQASDEFAPHIASDDAPIKMKPDEPGGMKIPHQNRHVYDMVTSPENRERKIEHLLPPPETPILAQSVEEPTEDNASQNLEQLREEANAAERNIESIVKTQPIAEEPQQVIPDITPEIIPSVLEKKSFDQKLAELIPQEKPKIIEPKEPLIEKKEIQIPTSVVPPVVKTLPKTTQNPAGNVRLQLGAVKTAQEAQKEIGRLRKAYPDLFKNCDLIAKNVDLGPKGIFYRIQTTGMPQSEAEKINEMLKKLKQACFIVKP